jgi:hypothetical protein
VFASQCYNENVQGCRSAQKTHTASKTQTQDLKLSALPFARYEVLCVSLFIKVIARRDLKVNEPVEFILSQTKKVANHVGDKIAALLPSAKSERQQCYRLFGGMERIRSEEASHVFLNPRAFPLAEPPVSRMPTKESNFEQVQF